jgi:hypothetical protein
MYSENGVQVDFDEVSKLIASADVFAIGFANFSERLLVDARTDDKEMPLIQVVEPAGSPQRRLRWLMRRRPSLGEPQAFSFVAWPHSPKLLIDSGMWHRIEHRVRADIDADMKLQCDLAIRELHDLEMEAVLAAIRGDNYATIFPKDAAAE